MDKPHLLLVPPHDSITDPSLPKVVALFYIALLLDTVAVIYILLLSTAMGKNVGLVMGMTATLIAYFIGGVSHFHHMLLICMK